MEFLPPVMRLGHLLTLHQPHPFVSQTAEGSGGPRALRITATSSALRWPPWSTPNCHAFQQVCMGGAAL